MAPRCTTAATRLGLMLGLAGLAACSVSEEDERMYGEYSAAQVDSSVPIVGDTAVTVFVSELGRSLAANTSRADLDWRFAVVNTAEVNAFALPGGFIYVTRGLIETVDRFDQLAGVVAHEVSHVVLRHSVDQLEKEAKRDVGLVLLCTLTDACNGVGGAIAVQVGSDAMAAQYSQQDEAEADSLAVVIAPRAGFDPGGLAGFLAKMLDERTGQPTPIEAFFATHPTDEARIVAVRRHVAALGPLPAGLVRDTPEFHAVQARLRAMAPPPQPEPTD